MLLVCIKYSMCDLYSILLVTSSVVVSEAATWVKAMYMTKE